MSRHFIGGRLIQVICIAAFSMLASSTLRAQDSIENKNITESSKLISITGYAQGTTYSVKGFQTSTDLDLDELKQKIEWELNEIDKQVSNWRIDSEVSQINAATNSKWIDVSHDTAYVISNGMQSCEELGGTFDITIGPLTKLWGFRTRSGSIEAPTVEAIASVLESVGHDRIKVRMDPPAIMKLGTNVEIDLAGIAQGYSVDRLVGVLQKAGLNSFLVEIGGEAAARGKKPDGSFWRIGVERPSQSSSSFNGIHLILNIENLAVSTSGDYRKFSVIGGKRRSHIIDPRSGRPVDNRVASVTVVSDSCMRSDVLSTALMVMGDSEGLKWATKNEVAALFVLRENDEFALVYTDWFAKLIER
jgi:thiamine biosynthesis lipoprotein